MKKTKTIICVALTLLTIISLPFNCLLAMGKSKKSSTEKGNSKPVDYNYLESEIIDALGADELMAIQRRLDNPKDDLRTVRFLMNDGTEEMLLFNEAIKYIDNDGQVHTKSMELFENNKTEKYKFSNKYNDIVMSFGRNYSDGVSIKYKEYEISIYPEMSSKTEAKISEDNRMVYYEKGFSEQSRVEYVAEYSGLKERIILEKYEGINKFSFILNTELSLKLSNGVVKAYEGNTLVGTFGSAFVTDMRNNGIVGEISLEQTGTTEYKYIITVPTDYFLNEETVYPIIVDPTFYFNQYANNFAGYKQIYDVTLYESGNAYYPDDEVLSLNGMPYSGKSKVLIKLPNILSVLKKIGGGNILGVYLAYTGLTNSTNSVVIKPMDVNWNTSASSLTPLEYAALYNGTLSNHDVLETVHQASGAFNITSIATDWMNSSYPNRGIMIENLNMYGFNYVPSTEYTANSYYRPYIKVRYTYTGQNNNNTIDPHEGLFKLKPVDSSGLTTFFAMKNTNSIVTTTITTDVYNNDQLLYVTSTPFGYTIQNPYNDYYLTSIVDSSPNNCLLYFSQTLTSSSYWSFVDSSAGYYIVGTSQEQVCCPTPYTLSSSIVILTLLEGIAGNQSNTWTFERQIDKIPCKLKNVSSGMYLTVTRAYDYDYYPIVDNRGNIFQHSLYTTTTNDYNNLVFGSQSIRPVKNEGSGGYTIYLMSSKNGRFRSIAWDSTGNAFQYNPSSSNNRFTITIDNSTGYAKIKQKTGSHLVLSVTDDNEGSESGINSDSYGNIIFASPDNQDLKQKWVLIVDLEQLKKETYYSQFDVCLPLPNSTNKQINSDYGPRLLKGVFSIHDGIDLYAEMDTPVYATITGKVVAVVSNLNNPNVNPTSRGLYVLIRSEANNTIYKYGTNSPLCMLAQHLNSTNVSVGQSVTAGQIIGYTGRSGLIMYAYLPHFHYAYCTESDFLLNEAYVFVDPLFLHTDASFYETTEYDGAYNLIGLE